MPVSLAVDEEGGRVQWIDELDGSVPSARQMAETMDLGKVQFSLYSKTDGELDVNLNDHDGG